MGLDNDARGWIMAAVSGIACTVGASIICVDLVVRLFPGKKDFKIEDSNSFLSVGLSLSFGVMIFSSLYSMLPSAKTYLEKGGMAARPATFTLVGCFLAGAVGIAVLSQILHRYIPHSVVDCDNDHGDEEEGKADGHDHDLSHSHHSQRSLGGQHTDGRVDEESFPSNGSTNGNTIQRRPSLHMQLSSRVTQLVKGTKEFCDEDGQCRGCFDNIHQARNPRVQGIGGKFPKRVLNRTQTTPHERQALLQDIDTTTSLHPTTSVPANPSNNHPTMNGHSSHASLPSRDRSHSLSSQSTASAPSITSHPQQQPHHHHVPTNTFLSIGLQTSTAIALHKIPEGFITYATNHANPRLGFSIFLALFVHNITEGFAMALPLYLAINSRWKALFFSSILGGVSQPLGAGVAALWFKISGSGQDGSGAGRDGPSDTVYGAMFAVTAGIMAMVSLQLFGEALDLTRSRKLCFGGALLGMGILGVSSALTA